VDSAADAAGTGTKAEEEFDSTVIVLVAALSFVICIVVAIGGLAMRALYAARDANVEEFMGDAPQWEDRVVAAAARPARSPVAIESDASTFRSSIYGAAPVAPPTNEYGAAPPVRCDTNYTVIDAPTLMAPQLPALVYANTLSVDALGQQDQHYAPIDV